MEIFSEKPEKSPRGRTKGTKVDWPDVSRETSAAHSSDTAPSPTVVPMLSASLRRGLCVLYVMLLLSATLLKGWLSIDALWDVEAQRQRSLDFELFDGFAHPAVWWAPWLNTVGNVLLFMPLGAFVARGGGGRYPLVRAGAIGAALSLSIEVTQYIAAVGYSDVDDLLCNTLGAVLGAALYRRYHQGPRAAR